MIHLDGDANNAVFVQSDAAKSEAKVEKILYITVSSDRGLCGGIHSSVAKVTRNDITEGEGVGKECQVVVLGEKPKQQLTRGAIINDLALTFNQIGRNVPTFSDALAIADKIEDSGLQYDKVRCMYLTGSSLPQTNIPPVEPSLRSRSPTTNSSPLSLTRVPSSRSTPSRPCKLPPLSPLTKLRVMSSLPTSDLSLWPTLSTLP